MIVQNECLIPANFQDTTAHLINTRRNHDCLEADDIDFEMRYAKREDKMMLRRLSQDGLEHFVRKYGRTYQILRLDSCTRIKDFSPLSDLPNLEAICIDWCKNSVLWDMSRNTKLKILSLSNCKKLTYAPQLLETGKTLEEVRFWGPTSGGTYPMATLDCFRNMDALRRIDLNWVSLADKSLGFLDTLPNLEEFHFDAGMLTTEEIAFIVARYPNLYGQCLGPYDDTYMHLGEVRVCGSRKPTLRLPKQQACLDDYIRQFHDLVEQYRRESPALLRSDEEKMV